MSSRCRVMTGLRTWRCKLLPGCLHPCHICPFQTGGFRRCSGRQPQGFLPSVFGFHLCHLCLFLHFGFEACVTVRIDGFFSEVVCAAARCDARLASCLSCIVTGTGLTHAQRAPANPIQSVSTVHRALIIRLHDYLGGILLTRLIESSQKNQRLVTHHS